MLYQARAVTIELVSLNHLQKIQIDWRTDAKVDKRKKQSKCYLAAKCFFLSCLAYCNHCQACCLLSLFILNIHISPLKLKVYRKYIWQLRLEILFVWKFNVFANKVSPFSLRLFLWRKRTNLINLIGFCGLFDKAGPNEAGVTFDNSFFNN